mmetsp:Transcript_129218/g.374075  ORF Transcript_129218/g.374075 Transcript_129218/m.374075 type:complete len:245 (-) Transcript_129218:95-829(-)
MRHGVVAVHAAALLALASAESAVLWRHASRVELWPFSELTTSAAPSPLALPHRSSKDAKDALAPPEPKRLSVQELEDESPGALAPPEPQRGSAQNVEDEAPEPAPEPRRWSVQDSGDEAPGAQAPHEPQRRGVQHMEEETPGAPAPPVPQRRSIQDVKDEVILTEAFGRKTQALCVDAQPDDIALCRRHAGQRLFCALMARHMDSYKDLDGVGAEKEKCKSIDTMVNAAEAARDERLEKDASQA